MPPDPQRKPRRAPAKPAASRVWSRPPLSRMLRIDAQIRAGKYPNSFTLAAGLEVSRKTIVRDIAFMRHRLDLPIEFDPVRNGYFYSAAAGPIPLLNVTSGELLALFIARQALEQYRGTPFLAPLRKALEKITSHSAEEFSFSWDDLQNGFSFGSAGLAAVQPDVFDAASRAVLERREIEFEYQKLGSPRHEPRSLQPCHLACIGGQWYLFGHDPSRGAIRTFALTRMRSARVTRRGFTRPASFSLSAFLRDSFGVVEGKKPQTVRIRFTARAARLVRERVWHHSQKITSAPGGGIILELRLGSLLEIQPWILSWGPQAEVLAPAQLRSAVRAAFRAAARLYESPEQSPAPARPSAPDRPARAARRKKPA